MPQLQRSFAFMFLLALLSLGLAAQRPTHLAAWSAEDHVFYLPYVSRPQDRGVITRASKASDGAEGNGGSGGASLSGDGRLVAFDSWATNFVEGDDNAALDVFVHNLDSGETRLVSVASDGSHGNGSSFAAAISADGHYVAFQSSATTFVPDDTNTCTIDPDGYQECYDIFVHDLASGATERISEAVNGAEANGSSDRPALSANGRFLAFSSDADNLVPADVNGIRDIFVHDRQTGLTELVSVATGGWPADGASHHPVISADGRYIAFHSTAVNLVPGDTNSLSDVFVHDRWSHETTRVSVASDGSQLASGADFYESSSAAISGNGRFVAFYSQATGSSYGFYLFVHDQQTGVTSAIPAQHDSNYFPWERAALSFDGRFVAFWSQDSFLVVGDSGYPDIFVYDRETGAFTRVSAPLSGGHVDDLTEGRPAISSSGRYVAYASRAGNLVTGDTNRNLDVFVHDRGWD